MCLLSLHFPCLSALPLHLLFLSPSYPLFTSWRARTLSFPTLVLKYASKGYAIVPFLLTPSPSKGPASSVTFSSAYWPWLGWLLPAPGSGGLTGRMSVAMVSVSIPLFSCISGQSSARQCWLAPWKLSGNSEIACWCPCTQTPLFFSIFDP